MASLATTALPRTPRSSTFSLHSHSRRASLASPFIVANKVDAMTPPCTSSPPPTSRVLQPYSFGSDSGSSGSSLGGSDSEDEDDVPATPGDDFLLSSSSTSTRDDKLSVAAPTPFRTTKGVELSRLFDAQEQKENEQVRVGVDDDVQVKITPSRPADQVLTASAKAFFPSFGDFLPSVKREEEAKRAVSGLGIGLGLGWQSAPTTAAIPSLASNEENVEQLVQRTGALSLEEAKVESKPPPVFHPSLQLASPSLDPESDSFTFFPSPGLRSSDGSSSNSTKPTSFASSSSAALLSPKPERPAGYSPHAHSFGNRAQEAGYQVYQQQQQPRQVQQDSGPLHSHHHAYHPSVTLPGFPVTPPRTPVRSSFDTHTSLHGQQQQSYYGYPTPPSLPHHQQHPHQRSPAPSGYYALPASSLPSTPSSSLLPLPLPLPISSAAPYPLPVSPLPVTTEQAYPLSPQDTDRIAKLHNGRIPTLQQLSPPEAVSGLGGVQPPIVNTGNSGAMVVQAGDWRCGVCAFVNWRRRKICLRCFPYANDIGNILTIQSQRAAHLALPSSTSLASLSAPPTAHQASFHIAPAAPAYSPSSSGGGAGEGVTSAQAVLMARSSTYPPSRTGGGGGGGYGSLAMLEQGVYSPYQQQNSTPPPQRSFSYGSYSPAPTTSSITPRYQPVQPPSSLPPVLYPYPSPGSSSSSGGGSKSVSATSAGEHAAMLRARRLAAAREEGKMVTAGGLGGVEMYPSLTGMSGMGDDGGWGEARRSGFVAPGGGPEFVGAEL
ncbi:hypothetical protein JCM8547_006946 [Rhodosporidiobolus lusitaniae]